MSHELEARLRAAVAAQLQRAYGLGPDQLPSLVVEAPPRPELGEFALPVCFELSKRLRRAPRQLAQELAAAMGTTLPEGFVRVTAEGGGYLNFHVNRAEAVGAGPAPARASIPGKVIVEHTNINPNKAAHIGHLRNAVLGDTWVQILRTRGQAVEVQNLQDNTGVQVADVVAAFLHLEGDGDVTRALARVRGAVADPAWRFDYLCWDLYAAISKHYESSPESQAAWRGATLQAIEAGNNPIAELAETISSAIAEHHLRTMQRIGVVYDVLPRESEILHRHLWDYAFRLLRDRGAVRLEAGGKNAGCWVMDRAAQPRGGAQGVPAEGRACAQAEGRSATPVNVAGEEDSKVIVRSNGTVTYVGKDIAYQLWKFGLLPLEFDYARFHRYPDGAWAWRTAMQGESDAPTFGKGLAVYNVIDARQSYLQDIVVAGLRALGYDEQAERSIHFSYEMVALSAACAIELGFAASAEDKRVDVSGRKGTGVKADDLLDRLLQRTRAEVAQRNPDLDEMERQQ
ncbi:MAG: arginine--tRNA ligase, partial [Terriglobales bacterium]